MDFMTGLSKSNKSAHLIPFRVGHNGDISKEIYAGGGETTWSANKNYFIMIYVVQISLL